MVATPQQRHGGHPLKMFCSGQPDISITRAPALSARMCSASSMPSMTAKQIERILGAAGGQYRESAVTAPASRPSSIALISGQSRRSFVYVPAAAG
jgi:hypothetical protein